MEKTIEIPGTLYCVAGHPVAVRGKMRINALRDSQYGDVVQLGFEAAAGRADFTLMSDVPQACSCGAKIDLAQKVAVRRPTYAEAIAAPAID